MSVRWPDGVAVPKNGYRFGTFALVVVVAVTALGAQMGNLQLLQHPAAYTISSNDSTISQSVPASRGLIFDADNKPLVENLPNYTIEVVPNLLPLADKPVVVERLASLLKVDPVLIYEAIDSATGSLYDPVVVASGVETDVARLIDENRDVLPGVRVLAQQLRRYPQGALLGQILGYTGRITADELTNFEKDPLADHYSKEDTVGKAGLEAQYESELRGTYGSQTVALDANGQPITGLATQVTSPTPGKSLQLSISIHEQQLAQQALSWGLAKAHITKGVIIVENPQNGEILAMVSLPGYDDEKFAQGISQADYAALANDPNGPLINKAVVEQYAPGSTYKLVTGTAGLETGKITATSTIESMPYYLNGGERFKEWNNAGWGPLNIIMGMAHSSDTFFYQLADRVGLTNLSYWARQYGFGWPTGIDLPGEAAGIVPDNNWAQTAKGRDMYSGEVLQAGIGQGYDAATPLQLLNAYCALANGGTLWTPHIVKSETWPDGTVHPVAPVPVSTPGQPTGHLTNADGTLASQENLQTLRLATRAVVTSRHTYNLVDLPVMVAGKTGTAEFGNPDRLGRYPYHEWFVGYTPADWKNGNFSGTDSQLAVVVFTYGANTLGDISTEIVKYYLALHYKIPGFARNPTDTRLPGFVRAILFKRTNFAGTANNH
jgi:penicillin-binding protein 2